MRNNVHKEDIYANELNRLIQIKIENYIILSLKIESTECVLILINRKFDGNSNNFSITDKFRAQILGYLLILCQKLSLGFQLYEHENQMKSLIYSWTEQLLSTYNQFDLLQIMENQVLRFMKVKKAKILYYDTKRNEVYRRLREEDKELIASKINSLEMLQGIDWEMLD